MCNFHQLLQTLPPTWSSGASNKFDGLTTNGILLMHPSGYFEQGVTSGEWREVTVMGSIHKTRLKRSSKSPGSPVSLCPLNNNGGMLCSLHDMYVAYVCTSMTGLTYIQAVHTSQYYIYVVHLVAIIISTFHLSLQIQCTLYFMCTYLWMSPNVHTYAQYPDSREHVYCEFSLICCNIFPRNMVD